MKQNEPTERTPESDIIRAGIEQTRLSMDHTLDEIGAKMKPQHLFDELLGLFHLKRIDGDKLKHQAGAVMHSTGQAAGRAAHVIGDAIREHPIPTLLIGAGVAWAIYESSHTPQTHWGSSRHKGNGHGDGATPRGLGGNANWQESVAEDWEPGGLKEKAAEGWESAKDGVESAAENVKEKMSAVGHTIRQRASDGARAIGQKATQLKDQLAHTAQRGFETGREKFVETSQSHPLCVGLGFLAAGVLAGLALPPSRKEDEWVGEAADRVKDQARARGEDLVERGKKVASAAVDAVKQTAAEEGLTPQALKEKVQHVAAKTEEAAQRSAEQQGLKAAPPVANPAPAPCPDSPPPPPTQG